MMNNKRIPIFFACDDNFVKFTIVAITSLKANASKDYIYDIHILYTKMSEEMKKLRSRFLTKHSTLHLTMLQII